MSVKDPKETVKDMEDLVGRSEARRLLVLEDVSPHTADKLLGNRYEPEIRGLLAGAIARAHERAKKQAQSA